VCVTAHPLINSGNGLNTTLNMVESIQ